MAAADAPAVHAVASELDAIGATLAAAFAADPVQQWLFEPAADPDAARGRFFRFFVDEYFPLGHTYRAGPGPRAGGPVAGAALWAPPDRDILHGERVGALLAMVTADLGEETIPRLSELARAAELRPSEPHFYLGILGVDPARQGGGLGAVLVEPVLDACDRGGFVAHLESSNPRNLGFYERLGFVTTDSFRCGSASGPLMTVMSRAPAEPTPDWESDKSPRLVS